jgi:hypothetical protein
LNNNYGILGAAIIYSDGTASTQEGANNTLDVTAFQSSTGGTKSVSIVALFLNQQPALPSGADLSKPIDLSAQVSVACDGNPIANTSQWYEKISSFRRPQLSPIQAPT